MPLVPWTLQKVCGPMLNRDQWREIARSLVPPSQSVSDVILKEAAVPISPALLSPSWRRKLRSSYRHFVCRQLHGNPLALAARQYLLEWKAKLEKENMEYSPTPTPIRKLADIEAERRMEFEEMAQKPEEIGDLFPPEKVLDPRVYSQMMKELGSDGYNLQVIGFLMEFALRGESTVRPEITSRSNLWPIIGVDPKMLDSLSPEAGMILILDAPFKKVGAGLGKPDDEVLRYFAEHYDYVWEVSWSLMTISITACFPQVSPKEIADAEDEEVEGSPAIPEQ